MPCCGFIYEAEFGSGKRMPVVSRFYGTGIVTGSMSKRALQMVFAWAEQHQKELVENWNRARERKPLLPIAPLT